MGAKPRAFKHQLGPERTCQIGDSLAAVSSAFDRDSFVASACAGLEEMELKARVSHLIACLHQALPQPFPRAIAVIRAAAARDDELRHGDARHLRGFAAWPLIDYVGEHGLEHPELALEALRELTSRFSAEFAVRPFLRDAPLPTLAIVERWTADESEHVRRLASEGTRPLLPWGVRLTGFVSDPAPVIAILERLKHDSSEYVRRSVANNLNDIAKHHPETVVEVCRRWQSAGVAPRLIARALRTLIKNGNPAALAIQGFDSKIAVRIEDLTVNPARVREGGAVEIGFELCSLARASQRLNIDYAIHYVKSSGARSAKVFKLKRLSLEGGASQRVRKKHSFKRVTTRVHYRGTHLFELFVNGNSVARASFELVD